MSKRLTDYHTGSGRLVNEEVTMAFTVEQSIEIERPRQEVWDYVIEHDEWRRPQILEVRPLSDGPPDVGTRYEDKAQMMGREMKVVNELVRFEPPRLVAWTQVERRGPLYTVEGRYELASVDGGTRFTLSADYEAPGLWRLVAPLIRRQINTKIYPSLLGQLKSILEAEQKGRAT
jgi:uncharacterized membrane protein